MRAAIDRQAWRGFSPGTGSADAALVRLHAALKTLDAAMFDALRCLDVALGRDPTSAPPEELSQRELGRLKLHLEAAVEPQQERRDRDLGAMALTWDEAEAEDAHDPSEAVNA